MRLTPMFTSASQTHQKQAPLVQSTHFASSSITADFFSRRSQVRFGIIYPLKGESQDDIDSAIGKFKTAKVWFRTFALGDDKYLATNKDPGLQDGNSPGQHGNKVQNILKDIANKTEKALPALRRWYEKVKRDGEVLPLSQVDHHPAFITNTATTQQPSSSTEKPKRAFYDPWPQQSLEDWETQE